MKTFIDFYKKFLKHHKEVWEWRFTLISVDFLEKGRVLWFQSLFSEFTLCYKIRNRLLGQVYHFSLLICYPYSFISSGMGLRHQGLYVLCANLEKACFFSSKMLWNDYEMKVWNELCGSFNKFEKLSTCLQQVLFYITFFFFFFKFCVGLGEDFYKLLICYDAPL